MKVFIGEYIGKRDFLRVGIWDEGFFIFYSIVLFIYFYSFIVEIVFKYLDIWFLFVVVVINVFW